MAQDITVNIREDDTYVVNVSKQEEYSIELTEQGPQGLMGPVGPQGPQGPRGPQGPQGEMQIQMSDEEPTDENILVWIDTSEEPITDNAFITADDKTFITADDKNFIVA